MITAIKQKFEKYTKEKKLYVTSFSMGLINANPHETHFINTSVSSSETVSGLVAAEPAGVS